MTARALPCSWTAGLTGLVLGAVVAVAADDVRGPAADPVRGLRDVTGVEDVPLPPPMSRWPYWLAAGSAVGAGLILAGRAGLRRRPRTPALAPEQWAARELDRVEALRLAEAGEAGRYVTHVSDVVRGYLERRYQLRAPRQTTTEFLAALRHDSPLTEGQRGQLDEFLGRCDLVKFAGLGASPQDCRALADMARRLVSWRPVS